MDSRLTKKEAEAIRVVQSAMESYKKKMGRSLFLAGEGWDTVTRSLRSFRFGPVDVGRRALAAEQESSAGSSSPCPFLTDVSEQTWWGTEASRALVSWLVKNSEQPPRKPCWSDPSKRPLWWPNDVPYGNPTNTKIKKGQLHRVIIAAYKMHNGMELLGPKGAELQAAARPASPESHSADVLFQALREAGVHLEFQDV